MNNKWICSLEDYIGYMEGLKAEQEYMLFRGECRDYGRTACQPNIFRKGYLEKMCFSVVSDRTV